MSRTRKRFPRTMYRCPRGRKQALVAGVRKGAVPPDSWEDIRFDKQCWLPLRVSDRMRKRGWSERAILDRIRKDVPIGDRDWVVRMSEYSKPLVPEGCLGVYDEVRNKDN
jgi:hypothetical protein